MQVEPVRLDGRTVRLEPLTLDHAPDLWEASDPDLFTLTWSWAGASTLDEFRINVQNHLDMPDWCSFAIVLTNTGRAIGSTSYLEIRPAHRALEIGSTWIARPYQGTQVNPENKYLLLRHAFETLGAVRVQLKTDGRNLHSQRAIQKLGAVHEGVLRKHSILPDGYIRDTVMYSIIAEEWPTVKARLEARLGYIP